MLLTNLQTRPNPNPHQTLECCYVEQFATVCLTREEAVAGNEIQDSFIKTSSNKDSDNDNSDDYHAADENDKLLIKLHTGGKEAR